MIEDITRAIRSRIILESSIDMTDEQKYYVAGLSDALRMIEDYDSEQIAIGKEYFVITHIDMDAKVELMTLYRINKKKKNAYCFTRNYKEPAPDLVLYSKAGLKMRVFTDYMSAEKNIPVFLSYLEERERRYGKRRK